MLILNKNILTIGGNRLEGVPLTPPTPPGPVDPYNPLGLPPNTVRVRTNDGNIPVKGQYTTYETATLVPGTTDVYDVYKSGTDLSSMFRGSNNIAEVLGANTTGITITEEMFRDCSVNTVALFDTTNVTNMNLMFSLANLRTVPLFDTSKVTTMNGMLQMNLNVESGALALYQQASSQANPPSEHYATFRNCGIDTTTGAAELAQIPSSWGGTGA